MADPEPRRAWFVLWLTDLRRIALLASIASVGGVSVALWNSVTSLLASIQPDRASTWLLLLFIPLFLILAVYEPLFFYLLYRHAGVVKFSRQARNIGMIAAATAGLVWAHGFWGWLASAVSHVASFDWRVGGSTVTQVVQSPATSAYASSLFDQTTNIVYLVLLIAIVRRPKSDSVGRVPARFLDVTKAAVILSGLTAVGALAGVALVPYSHSLMRGAAAGTGIVLPSVGSLLLERVLGFLNQASWLGASYAVYISLRSGSLVSADIQTEPLQGRLKQTDW